MYVTRLPRAQVVALRKESVDRNSVALASFKASITSLSARRAWIEIQISVSTVVGVLSLSARRAWIEICMVYYTCKQEIVALRKESVDRNKASITIIIICTGRSPQGERG